MIMSLANPGMNIEQKIVPMLEIKGINVSRSRDDKHNPRDNLAKCILMPEFPDVCLFAPLYW